MGNSKFCGAWNFGHEEENCHSVLDLITEAGKYLDNFKYQINPTHFHEAGYLKLNIAKAKNDLEWAPVLNFNDNVAFAISGYQHEITARDIYEKRVEQVSEYVNYAQQKEIKWASVS